MFVLKSTEDFKLSLDVNVRVNGVCVPNLRDDG